MDQNTKTVTFVDILSMFVGKGKKIICIILVAGIICAAAGFCFSYLTAEYGGSITINVSVTDGSRSLITLLSSDKFAERLLLDENGLPPKEYCNAEDYQAALDAANAYNAARETKKELIREQQLFEYGFALVEDQYNQLVAEYTRIYNILSLYTGTNTGEGTKDPSHIETTQKYEKLLEEAALAKDTYQTEVRQKEVVKKLELNQKIAIASRTLKDTRLEYDKASTKVISQWMQDPELKEILGSMSGAISCEYLQRFENVEVKVEEDVDPTELENSRFIVINVSAKDRELAGEILQKIIDVAPAYVEEQLERLSGSTEPRCTVISTLTNAKNLSENGPLKTAVIAGAVGAIVAVVIYAFAVIVIGLIPPELAPKKKEKKAGVQTKEPENAA